MSQLPYTVWVAQYASTCKYVGKYLLWQFTSRANVPGVLKPCDMSYVIDSKEKNPYREPATTVREGDSGVIVKWVQWYVRVKEDGDFGDKTKTAVIAYQKKAFPTDESEWDGIVGPDTIAAFKKNGRA
jgi:peptidoglycan hydrolase-like protein with peptidoglycan-binding domain